jgi:HlyD family secretion protein
MNDPALSFRGPVLLGLLALAGLFLGFGAWAFLARLEGAVILAGQIVVEDHRQVIQHPEGGLVAEVFVREGSSVAAGDPLLRLEAPELVLDLRNLDRRLAGLSARAARLTAERDAAKTVSFSDPLLASAALAPDVMAEVDGQNRHFDLRLALFNEAEALLALRLAQFRSQSSGIVKEQQALEDQLALIREELASQTDLFQQGLLPHSDLLALRREAARLAGQIAELSVAKAQTAGQMTETELRIGGLRTERMEAAAAELREVEPQIAELEETRRSLADRVDLLTVRAPVAGIVLGLQTPKPQVVLRAAEPILSLVPIDPALLIMVRVRPEDIDTVSLGQKAELAISAFSRSEVPRLRAQVTLIAADALTDPETGVGFYPVELTLDPGETDRLGGRVLLPGMRVEAYVTTGTRSPMAYLLEPFTIFFGHAMREG